jgi:predicted phosphodiesterase
VGQCHDNEGNKVGLRAGFQLIGQLTEPPARLTTTDGTRIILAHMKRQLRNLDNEYDIAVFGHTHKPRIERDDAGRLLINPGETSGWSFGRPTIAVLETRPQQTWLLDLVP